MEVGKQVLEPLRRTSKDFHHQMPYKAPTKALDIKVMYVRIINPTCMRSSVVITFPPRDPDARLSVNGTNIGPAEAFSMAMNKSRVDTLTSESIHVSTNSIRFRGYSLAFEIRAQGSFSPFVVGVVRRGEGLGGCKWAMECRNGGNCYERSLDGVMVDVYFAGRSMERPLLLNEVVQWKNGRRMLGCTYLFEGTIGDDAKGFGEQGEFRNHKDMLNKYSCNYEEELLEESTDQEELSWFNAGVGVGVGMGLGLGVCLGVGMGIGGLVLRAYQRATGAFTWLV